MKRLYLSDDECMIAGICGGIGETYDVDPTLVRLALVFLCVVTAVIPLGITYLVGWFIIPKKPAQQ